jgi:hypothetical protein
MDRNEKYRQKLYAQSREKPKRISGIFDADPYVDFVMARLIQEMEDDEEADANVFLKDMMDNPELGIVFGKSSALSMIQKSIVVTRLIERFKIMKDFDPTPYVDKLIDLFNKRELDQFKKYDKEGDYVYDFKGYFNEENFTREQLQIIQTSFYDRQSEKADKFKRKLIPVFILSVILVLVPPFFIPNLLQKMGWLSLDAGWFFKIGVGLFSVIVLFFFVKYLFFLYVDTTFKSKKRFLDLDLDDEKLSK